MPHPPIIVATGAAAGPALTIDAVLQERAAWIRRAGREAAVALFFLALAVVATRPLAFDLRGQTLAGPDPIIDLWTVHWLTSHALAPSQLFEGNVFHPFRHAALHSDLSLGTAVLLLPLRPFVRDPVPLYNLGVLVALAFGGWSFCALVRAQSGSLWAGLLSGVLAAFGSHQLYHVYHLNLLSIGWLALLLLALQRLHERPGPGPALLAGLSFALCALSSGYYAVAAALLALVFAALHPGLFRGRRLLAALGALLLAALLVLPYVLQFFELREDALLRRPLGLSARMAFQPGRDLGSRAFVHRAWLGAGGEMLFPGVLCLTLGTVALWRRRPRAGTCALGALVLLLVSLGPRLVLGEHTLSLPYRILFALPPLEAMRHPYTFAAVASLCLAVLAGLGWAGLALAGRRWAGPAVVALAVVETLGPAVRVRPVPPGVPEVYERLARLPPGAVLEVPPFAPEAMLWAARHGLPTVNGIGAFAPPQTARLQNQIRTYWLGRRPQDLDQSPPTQLLLEHFDLRYLVVDTRRPALRSLARGLDRSLRYRLLFEGADGRRLYELSRAP